MVECYDHAVTEDRPPHSGPVERPSELLDSQGRLRRSLVAVMAVGTGLAVANNYYAQPLLPAIGRSLHMGAGEAGLIVTFAQVGYALGLLFFLPLGDLWDRRRLIVVLCVATAAALLVMASAPSGSVLLPAAAAVGAFSVLAQVLVPFAASLAPGYERGRVVGMVMSGLLVGILLARTVAGAVAGIGGFRVVYVVAAAAMLVQAVVNRATLPAWREPTALGYPALLGSVFRLLAEEPVLRRRAQYGLLSFGSFSAFWTSMAFMLARHYHYSTPVIGLFGLVGAAGAVAATTAGRLSDRGWARWSTVGTAGLLVASWLLLWWGHGSLAALILGIVALDVGSQGIHITNQGEIYKLRPEARSRLTSAYMVLYFVGGGIGSAGSAFAYDRLGWDGVCLVGGIFALGALALWWGTELTRDDDPLVIRQSDRPWRRVDGGRTTTTTRRSTG
jgi:predicted MFS family arabinose efflux permease